MKLIRPTLAYKESFDAALAEFNAAKDEGFWGEAGNPEKLEQYIAITADWAKGERLPKGWIPASTFWLIDDENFVGHVSIRHTLTEQLRKEGGHIGYAIRPTERKKGYGKKILELSLLEAKKLGIEKVLVTCDETNEHSKKIIEFNGGVLEKAQDLGPDKPLKLLYWFDVSKGS